jgi:hypothetical protein
MKIPMNLPQSMNAVFQTPTPVDTGTLDSLKSASINTAVAGGITVDKPHDALGMSDQLPYPADIKPGFAASNAVNLDKVITERVGPLDIEGREPRIISHPGEFFGVAMALRIVRQYEELDDVAKRNRAAIAPHCGNIDGSHVFWKEVETGVVP